MKNTCRTGSAISRTIVAMATMTAARTVAAPWKTLPEAAAVGEKAHTGAHVSDPRTADWRRPPFIYDPAVATGPKRAKVIVLIFNPVVESRDGARLIEHLNANDPWQYSRILAETIRTCSGGYIDYDIVAFIEADEYPEKIDGFRYTDDSFLDALSTGRFHDPDRSDYRRIFETHRLIERVRDEGVTEIWMWGAGGFGFDELAMYIPNRYGRFAPTDNPWFYRPYEIPEEVGRTVWVMGFNYQVGPDNMIHSYTHRVESILALQLAGGIWDKDLRGADPWNTFSSLELDRPGRPSHVGNCHVPPNGQGGYDYSNARRVLSYADNWFDYPDLSLRKPRLVGSEDWGGNQFGFQRWYLAHIPNGPGYTAYGYDNWWVYIANTDEDLPNAEDRDRGSGDAALHERGVFVPPGEE